MFLKEALSTIKCDIDAVHARKKTVDSEEYKHLTSSVLHKMYILVRANSDRVTEEDIQEIESLRDTLMAH